MSIIGKLLRSTRKEMARNTKKEETRRVKRSIRTGPRDQTGVKRLYMIGPLDGIVRTAYGAKAVARRRARNKVAKQARKRNRRG